MSKGRPEKFEAVMPDKDNIVSVYILLSVYLVNSFLILTLVSESEDLASIYLDWGCKMALGGAILHYCVTFSADVQEEEEVEVTEAPHMEGGSTSHHKTIYILISHQRACILMKWRRTQKGQR